MRNNPRRYHQTFLQVFPSSHWTFVANASPCTHSYLFSSIPSYCSRNPQARPPAAVLLQHRYLELPSDYVFQLPDIERSSTRAGLKRSQGSRHRNSSAPAPRHRRSATTTDAPPLPTGSGNWSTVRTTDYLQPPSLDTSTLRPDSHRRSPSRPPSNEPPPIVYITPPSSPVRTSSRNSMSPATSESTRTSGSLRPRKSFYVVNPDPEPSDKRGTGFVFNPPPLPASATLRPSVAPQLSQRRSMADFKAEERRASTMQDLAGRVGGSSSRQLTSRTASYYSDSDSDSNAGTSLWKKPPVELQKTPSPNKPSRQSRRSIIETNRESTWAPRPGVQDVYSNLKGFFPRVDLDKPIVSDRHRRAKSIRMVVELNRTNLENADGLRRAATTKLWGHRVEEVHQ